MVATYTETWVVYRAVVSGNPAGVNAVCRRSEWDRVEAARPGHRPLVRAGLATEGEAERLARGHSGDDPPPRPRFHFGTGQPG